MTNTPAYKITVPHFEGPFDLLLFFIERDELNIRDIPINKIIIDFLAYIHEQENLNIELGSEFIYFIATLMRIKAKMLLPSREKDKDGNEKDPRQDLADMLAQYQRFKEISSVFSRMEDERQLYKHRGNIQEELHYITDQASDNTEIYTISLFKLMKSFEKVLLRLEQSKIVNHKVIKYSYTTEQVRTYMIDLVEKNKHIAFEKIFDICENKMHAIFLLLSVLELTQQRYVNVLTGIGRNNFIIEWNRNREVELQEKEIMSNE